MSEVDIELPSLDDDIGLGEEDKGKFQSSQLDWYKGEKGRTDRIALVYFNSIEMTQLRKQLRQDPSLPADKQRAFMAGIRVKVAEKLGKTPDELEPADLLDTSEARFKLVSSSYKEGLGYVAWPKNLPPDEERVWKKLGEKKDYAISVVLVYPTDREGEVDRDRLAKGWKVMPWRIGSDKFEVIRKINKGLLEDGGSISRMDLNVSCTDTGFQKLTITPASQAIYLKNETLKKMVLAKAELLYSKLNPFRELSTEQLREKLGMSPAIVAPGSDANEDFSAVLSNI
jgi:hypothetical protein